MTAYRNRTCALGGDGHLLLQALGQCAPRLLQFKGLPVSISDQLPQSYLRFVGRYGSVPLPEWTGHWRLLTPDEVGPFSELEPELVESWASVDASAESESVYSDYSDGPNSYFRASDLRATIQISSIGDGEYVLLLNPCVRFSNGEWEAWMLGNTIPGVLRFPSFRDLMDVQLNELALMAM